MAVATAAAGQSGQGKPGDEGRPALMLGGYAALAESAWMGSVQATEVMEPLRLRWPRRWLPVPRLPSLRGLLTRELSIAEASFVLMASFFVSALLGAVRQAPFKPQFAAG